MNLDIDIGNTFLKWRLVSGQRVVQKGSVLTKEFNKAAFNAIADFEVVTVRVGSVAGAGRDEQLAKACRHVWQVEPLFAKTTKQCAGVINSYQDPSRMGVDRWLAMIAAYKAAGARKGVIVVDCGSAITVDYLTAEGEHQGGYIIPGLRLMRDSLLQNTAQVRFEKNKTAMLTSPGVNTAEAVLHGSAYLFKALAHQIKRDLNVEMDIFITGGDGALLYEIVDSGFFEPDLVMDGLVWVCS